MSISLLLLDCWDITIRAARMCCPLISRILKEEPVFQTELHGTIWEIWRSSESHQHVEISENAWDVDMYWIYLELKYFKFPSVGYWL